MNTLDYHIQKIIVLSNEQEISVKTTLPIFPFVENSKNLVEKIEKLVEGVLVGKSRQRRLDILKAIDENPNVSAKQLAEQLGISITAVQNHLDYLKNNNFIRRVGPDKGGHWEMVGISEKMSD